MGKHINNLLLLVFSTLVSLIAAEVGLRIIYDHELSGSWRVYDERGLHLNKSEGSAVHAGAGYFSTYSFQHPHLRGNKANEGKFRILVLGDSFTFGWLLNWQDTYVGRLEAHLRRAFGPAVFEIANAAAGGWRLDSYLAYLEGYGDDVAPEIVLVFLNTGDVSRSIINGLYHLDQGKLIASKKPVPLLKRIVQALPFYDDLISRSHLLDALRRSYLYLRYGRADDNVILGPGMHKAEIDNATGDQDAKAVMLAQRIFEGMIAWCKDRNVTLIVMTTAWHNPPYDSQTASEVFMAQATQFFVSHDVEFFDGSPLLVDRKYDRTSPIHIEGDGHPNEEGARLIAETNWPFLEGELTKFCRLRQCVEN